MASLPETETRVKPVSAPDSESNLTLTFHVGNLNREQQESFVQSMATAGMGLAAEGLYSSTFPVRLAEPLLRTATFDFFVVLGPAGTGDSLDLAVADVFTEALTIAHDHGARVLSASCPQ